jgi:hypothetical protein
MQYLHDYICVHIYCCLFVVISHTPFIHTTAAICIVNNAILFGSESFLIYVEGIKSQ